MSPFLRVVSVATLVVALLSPSDDARAAADAKAIVKCQAALKKLGAKFIGKKLGALAKCAGGVFKCVQTVDETADAGAKRNACITKGRGGCTKSLATITLSRQAFVDGVGKACADLDPTQVTGIPGLGFTANDCSEFAAPVTNVATLAACLAKQHDCLASRLFQLGEPRVREMLQFTPPDAVTIPSADLAGLACLEDTGGTGADVNDLVLGKSIVKCQTAVAKTGKKLAGARLKILEKCVDALFNCAATKILTDLTACRDKARVACDKAFTKSAEQNAALAGSLEKPCGDPALFAALLTPAGANFQALLPSAVVRAALVQGCAPPLTSVAHFRACILAEIGILTADLLRFQSPRAENLLAQVGCDVGGTCGPVPTASPTPGVANVTRIIAANGDGAGHVLDSPQSIAVDVDGTVYVGGCGSHNVFRIASNGTITQIIGPSGDGLHPLECAASVAVRDGTAYVAGAFSDNVFKITSNGTITQIIDASGGGGHALNQPTAIAVDTAGTVFVTGFFSENAFKITSGGTITQIIDANGDGLAGSDHKLEFPVGIATYGAGTAFVVGRDSSNAFKIDSGGTITRIIGPDGDGLPGTIHVLNFPPGGIAVDAAGTVYMSDSGTDGFKIESNGTISKMEFSGTAFGLLDPIGVAVDGDANVYVAGEGSDNASKIPPGGTPVQIISFLGDGITGHRLMEPRAIAVDPQGNVYVAGAESDNAFKIVPLD